MEGEPKLFSERDSLSSLMLVVNSIFRGGGVPIRLAVSPSSCNAKLTAPPDRPYNSEVIVGVEYITKCKI